LNQFRELNRRKAALERVLAIVKELNRRKAALERALAIEAKPAEG
jgi:hypothetical protein